VVPGLWFSFGVFHHPFSSPLVLLFRRLAGGFFAPSSALLSPTFRHPPPLDLAPCFQTCSERPFISRNPYSLHQHPNFRLAWCPPPRASNPLPLFLVFSSQLPFCFSLGIPMFSNQQSRPSLAILHGFSRSNPKDSAPIIYPTSGNHLHPTRSQFPHVRYFLRFCALWGKNSTPTRTF